MDSPTDQAPHISTTYPVGDTCASTGRQLNKPCLSKRRPPPATLARRANDGVMNYGVEIHCHCIFLLFIVCIARLTQAVKHIPFHRNPLKRQLYFTQGPLRPLAG